VVDAALRLSSAALLDLTNGRSKIPLINCELRKFAYINGDLFMEPEARTLLKTFSTVESAELASGPLIANGIECVIEANDAGGMLPFLQVPAGVKLFVPSSQFDEAKELLESSQTET
jgi:hypothetical protein